MPKLLGAILVSRQRESSLFKEICPPSHCHIKFSKLMSDKDQELLYGIAISIGKWVRSSLPKEIVVKKVGALLVSV